MRLGDYLSKEHSAQYEQVEKFVEGRTPPLGQPRKINIGQIACNFYCKKCDDVRTFLSSNNIQMIPITTSLISIDVRLACPVCKASVAVWFLVDVDGDITSLAPMVRLLKRNVKYTDNVFPAKDKYGKYSESLVKAEIAFREGLGAGAIVYLRKIFESVTYEVADENGINILGANGRKIPFRNILNQVCGRVDFIPQEFSDSEEGYKLFGELSNIVHGEFEEEEALTKYPALVRLVLGVLDKQIDRKEIGIARAELGWNSDREDSH